MTSGIECQTIERFDDLVRLEPEWWQLFESCPNATPFQSPAWLLAWWRSFCPGDLASVAVRREGMLVGLAPFYIETGACGRRLLPLGISLSDYHDVLVTDRLAGAGLVEQIGRSFDWIEWEAGELNDQAGFWSLPVPAGSREEIRPSSVCSRILIHEGGATLSRSRRGHIRLARNRAVRMGNARIRRAAWEEALGLLEELFRLHAESWSRRGEPGGLLADERVARFHRMALPALADRGMVRLYGLEIDGRMVGVLYALHHSRRTYAYMTGFDLDCSFASPGVILTAHALEEAAREGDLVFDLLRGEEAYKASWTRDRVWNRARVFRREAAHAGA